MADQVPADSTIAVPIIVADEAAGTTVPVDNTGTPLAIVAAQVTLDPANPTYKDKLAQAGLETRQ
jgi:hypothetical protein